MTNKQKVFLVIIAIVVVAISKLYEALGIAGFIALIIAVAYAIKMKLNHDQAEQLRKFNAMAFRMATEHISLETARALYRSNNFTLSQLQQLRLIQVIRESIEIALSSKKVDTAESRMDIANENYLALLATNTLAPDKLKIITDLVTNAKREFSTLRYTNPAAAYIEKAATLKTERSKLKYLGMAKEILADALHDPACDTARIQVLLNGIND